MNSSSSTELDSFFQFLKNFVNETILHDHVSVFQQALFKVHIRRLSIQRSKSLLYGISILVALFWPVDFLIITDAYGLKIFSVWRALTIFTLAGGIKLVDYVSFFQTYFNIFLFAGLSIYLPLTGLLFGSAFGLAFPWFYLVFLIPLFIVVFAFDFLKRIFACIWLTGLFLISYLVMQSAPLGFRYIEHVFTLSWSAVALGVLIGHAIYHLDFVNFLQKRLVAQQKQKVQFLAEHDQLTGLLERKEFDDRSKDAFQDCKRYDKQFSVLMIDLDHFKQINDNYGHQAGDKVLERMGTLISQHSRKDDIVGRYGGEEFCLSLPETSLESAVIVANRLRNELSELEFSDPDSGSFSVSCSVGAAVYQGECENLMELIKEADEALYEAKEQGRDRVVKSN